MFSKKKIIYSLEINGIIDGSMSFPSSKKADMESVMNLLHNADKMAGKEDSGVLIKLNTPGGTSGTSEETVSLIRKIRNHGIPVVASMTDVCCSGGYWIASACSYIFANSTTLTGSIGALMQIPNLKGLSEKIGITQETIKAGRMKDIGNMFREITEEERSFLSECTKETHEIFAEDVRKNRNIDKDSFPEFFDGRPFTALQGLEKGFIDSIGTYYDALEYLLQLMKAEESEVRFVKNKKKEGIISKIFSSRIQVMPDLNVFRDFTMRL